MPLSKQLSMWMVSRDAFKQTITNVDGIMMLLSKQLPMWMITSDASK